MTLDEMTGIENAAAYIPTIAEQLKAVPKQARMPALGKARKLFERMDYMFGRMKINAGIRLEDDMYSDITSSMSDDERSVKSAVVNALALGEISQPGFCDDRRTIAACESAIDVNFGSQVVAGRTNDTFRLLHWFQASESVEAFVEHILGVGDVEITQENPIENDASRVLVGVIDDELFGKLDVYQETSSQYHFTHFLITYGWIVLNNISCITGRTCTPGTTYTIQQSDDPVLKAYAYQTVYSEFCMFAIEKHIISPDANVTTNGISLEHIKNPEVKYSAYIKYADYLSFEASSARDFLAWYSIRYAIDSGLVDKGLIARTIYMLNVSTDSTMVGKLNIYLNNIAGMAGCMQSDEVSDYLFEASKNPRFLLGIFVMFNGDPYPYEILNKFMDLAAGGTQGFTDNLWDIIKNGYGKYISDKELIAERNHTDDKESYDHSVISYWMNSLIHVSDDYFCAMFDFDHVTPDTVSKIQDLLVSSGMQPGSNKARYVIDRYLNREVCRIAISMGDVDTRKDTAERIRSIYDTWYSRNDDERNLILGTGETKMRDDGSHSFVKNAGKSIGYDTVSDMGNIIRAIRDSGSNDDISSRILYVLDEDPDMIKDIIYNALSAASDNEIDYPTLPRVISSLKTAGYMVSTESILYVLDDIIEDEHSDISIFPTLHRLLSYSDVKVRSECIKSFMDDSIVCKYFYDLLNLDIESRGNGDNWKYAVSLLASILDIAESGNNGFGVEIFSRLGKIAKRVDYASKNAFHAMAVLLMNGISKKIASILYPADYLVEISHDFASWVGDTTRITDADGHDINRQNCGATKNYMACVMSSAFRNIIGDPGAVADAILNVPNLFQEICEILSSSHGGNGNNPLAEYDLGRPGSNSSAEVREFLTFISTNIFQEKVFERGVRNSYSPVVGYIILDGAVRLLPEIFGNSALAIMNIANQFFHDDAPTAAELMKRLGLGSYIGAKKNETADVNSTSLIKYIQIGSLRWMADYYNGNGSVGKRSASNPNVMLLSAEEAESIIPSGWRIPSDDDLSAIASIINANIKFAKTGFITPSGTSDGSRKAYIWRQPIEDEGETGLQIAEIDGTEYNPFADLPEGCRAALRLVQ